MSRALLLLTSGSMLEPRASTTPDSVSRAQIRKFCSGSRAACENRRESDEYSLNPKNLLYGYAYSSRLPGFGTMVFLYKLH